MYERRMQERQIHYIKPPGHQRHLASMWHSGQYSLKKVAPSSILVDNKLLHPYDYIMRIYPPRRLVATMSTCLNPASENE